MRNNSLLRMKGLAGWLLLALAGGSDTALAQWVTQTLTLNPGWNAVYLGVRPAPDDCDTLFAGTPVESVWDWNRTLNSAQFVQDPAALLPGAPGWLTWFPPAHPLASQSSLFMLRDGRPYLIKLPDNASPLTWNVTGRPSLRSIDWRAGAVNFVGFHVATNPAPTFASLFAGEAGLAGQPVYRLGAGGAWTQVTTPASTGPKPGEAYWVQCRAPATRSATIRVEAGSRDGLRFGRNVSEQALRIRNTSIGARTVSLRLLPSAEPPDGQPPLAGPLPLEYRDSDYASAQFEWKPLTNVLSFEGLPAGAEWKVRLAVRLAGLPAGALGAQYQAILEATDDAGARWLIPVSVEPVEVPTVAGPIQPKADESSNSVAGLWVGEATIDAVSQPAHPGDPQLPRPAGGQFSFRLLLHVDGGGTARLLRQAFLVRKPPTFRPDPDNPGFNLLDQPARTLVVTDESVIPQLIGTAPVVGRRVSSAAFGFRNPITLGGTGGQGVNTGTVTLDYDDPLNPFKHVYHPDHNNVDDQVPPNPLPEGKESFTVVRALALEFSAVDPLGLDPPGWGDTEIGGVYRETITGLHRSEIRIQGHFRLVQAARAADLNDGLAISLSPDFTAALP